MSTQQQNIEHAACWMGWEKNNLIWETDGGVVVDWNPYKSEDDFRILLEKMMKDEILWYEFVHSDAFPADFSISYLKATLEERMSAFLDCIPEPSGFARRIPIKSIKPEKPVEVSTAKEWIQKRVGYLRNNWGERAYENNDVWIEATHDYLDKFYPPHCE